MNRLKTTKPIDSAKIKALVRAKGKKIVWLAKRSGYELSSITSKLSIGEMSDHMREDVAIALGVEPEELLRND